MKILGLDASTSTIGRAVIDFSFEPKLIHIDFYKPIKNSLEDKNEDQLWMLLEAKRSIRKLIEDTKPDIVAIEDYTRFMKGRSGAGTIIPLALMNRTLCLMVKEEYPETLLRICNVMSIRTQLKKDTNRAEIPPKEEIADLLEAMLHVEIPRPSRMYRKKERFLVEREDMADALAVAYYAYKKESQKK